MNGGEDVASTPQGPLFFLERRSLSFGEETGGIFWRFVFIQGPILP